MPDLWGATWQIRVVTSTSPRAMLCWCGCLQPQTRNLEVTINSSILLEHNRLLGRRAFRGKGSSLLTHHSIFMIAKMRMGATVDHQSYLLGLTQEPDRSPVCGVIIMQLRSGKGPVPMALDVPSPHPKSLPLPRNCNLHHQPMLN